MISKWVLIMIILTPMGEVHLTEYAESSSACTQIYRQHAMAILPHEKVRYAQCSPVEEESKQLNWRY